ncbi:hypothetical protein SH668x_001103 [Planctomicrobium sp. SH668]|uniref:hypothetical protein n=1 Tax=Planctomicrobium sp. SH668 TaxID=3448126 RepID=UPI003F5BB9B8
MSTIVDDATSPPEDAAPQKTQYLTEDGQPNVALLQDRTPEVLKSSPRVVWLTLVLAGLYVYSNLLPIWHTDIWGHLSYGRWIVENRAVPQLEPLMPLSKGIPFLDLPWLSQIIGYGVVQRFGVTGLQFLNGLGTTLAVGLLAICVYNRTGRLGAALLTLLVFYWGAYQQFLVFRPQLAGLVCFAVVFMMAASNQWRRWYLVALPIVFTAWANLHGSFIVGFLLMGAFVVGRATDLYRHSRSWKIVISDRTLRGMVLATQLSLAAVLLNPYGLAIYGEIFAVSRHPNLETLIEWDPLTLRMKQGQAALVIALTLVALYRVSPRRVTAREVLLLCGFGIGMLWHSRMILWWSPVAAYYIGLHAAATFQKWWGTSDKPVKTGGVWTVASLGIIWIAFAYTPFGIEVIHGRPKDAKAVEKRLHAAVSRSTPIEIADYLNRNPPVGMVFNTYEWGDYLLWAGPKGMQIFANSHAHLIPEEIWSDYHAISRLGVNWEDRLNRYSVNTVVVDQRSRGDLIKALEKLTTWKKSYSDAKGAVFKRVKPL